MQRLRHLALAAGTLVSTPQQTVSVQDDIIVIEPANPQTVYMPLYNPGAVYGTWPYPDEPPDGFPPPPGYALGLGIGFGVGYGVFETLWGWGDWDWRRHEIRIDPGSLQPDRRRSRQRRRRHVAPRLGPYRVTGTPFPIPRGPAGLPRLCWHRSAAPRSPPAFESFGRGAEVRAQAARGQASRSAPPAPMRSAPAVRSAPAHGGGGGGRGHR